MFGVDELGMDLGTSTLHIVVRGKGIVLSEPAYVAYDRQTRNVVAVGEEARRMYGRTPAGLIVERPLRDGRIRSFDLVSKMLRYFMRKVIGKRATFRPKLLLALPGGMDDTRAVLEFLAEKLPKGGFLTSLMSQYTPFYRAKEHKALSRRISTYEYRRAVDLAVELGLTDGYMQQRSSAKEEYTPPFDLEGV